MSNYYLQIGPYVSAPGTLIFSSGVDPNTTVNPRSLGDSLSATIIGTDSVTGYSWETSMAESPNFSGGWQWNMGYNQAYYYSASDVYFSAPSTIHAPSASFLSELGPGDRMQISGSSESVNNRSGVDSYHIVSLTDTSLTMSETTIVDSPATPNISFAQNYNATGDPLAFEFGRSKILEVTTNPAGGSNPVLHQRHGPTTAVVGANCSHVRTDGRLQGYVRCPTSAPYFTSGYWKCRCYYENMDWYGNTNFSSSFDWNCIWEIFQKKTTEMGDSRGISTTYCNVIYGGQYGLADTPPYTLGWRLYNRYKVNSTDAWSPNWIYDNNTVAVPTNSWFTIEVFYDQGTTEAGRVWMRITPDGGEKTVLYNKYDPVANPFSDSAVSDLQMLKLYGSPFVYINPANAGYPIGIYYDDYQWWDCTQAEFDAWLAAGG